MNLLSQLSSQIGDKTEEANRRVVSLCLNDPSRIAEIGEGLTEKEPALVADCAEVLTKIAEASPQLIVPFADQLAQLLDHKTTRVRWESMHALALTAALVPDLIHPLLSKLSTLLNQDKSVIVRDYAIDCLGNYARTGEKAAMEAYPLLREATSLWEGKHLARILTNLAHIAEAAPSLKLELLMYANDHLASSRASVKKAAKTLWKAAQ